MKPLFGHGAALPAAPAKGAQTHGCQQGANAASHPNVPGSALSKSRADFCTWERLGSFLAAEVLWPCLRSSSWSVHHSHASELSLAPCIGEQSVGGGQQQPYGHKGLKWTPGPSLCHLWVYVWAHAGWPCGSDHALCRQGLSSPAVQRGGLCFSLYLQWYLIYSRVYLARAV